MEFKLIVKKINNTLSQSELDVFNTWYNEKVEHQNYFENVKENYANDISHIDIEKGWQQISTKLNVPKQRKINWRHAAAIIIFLSSSYFYLTKSGFLESETTIIVNNNVEAGTDKATLTLEDGTSIALQKGKQYESDNVKSDGEDLIYKEQDNSKEEIAYNYLTIPRGGQYHIKLSDGTEVWLNSESKLKYPINFIKGESRKVELLYGEAYFDVSPSTFHKGSKFEVTTKQQEVKVLGTQFNVKAYKDENKIFTTLVEGKVLVFNGANEKTLKPTDQSIISNKNSEISITTVNVYDEISWKEGVFSFKDMPLKDIMKVLSRWYDVDVVFVNKNLKNEEFFGVLKKNQNLEEILSTIKSTNFIKNYEIKNKTIILE
jgi:ferric-dicitrate binding protein FerR (iron transport regulator)